MKQTVMELPGCMSEVYMTRGLKEFEALFMVTPLAFRHVFRCPFLFSILVREEVCELVDCKCVLTWYMMLFTHMMYVLIIIRMLSVCLVFSVCSVCVHRWIYSNPPEL